jgi:multidrug efflux system membrane fusion protein
MKTFRRYLKMGVVVAIIVGVTYVTITQVSQRTAAPGPGGPGGRFRGAEGPVPVLVANTRIADVPVYLDGVGTTKALNTVTVRPQVDGKIIAITFTEGQDVERGGVLAQIDPAVYQAQLDQAVAKKAQDAATLANAHIDFDRYTKLVATNAINRQQLDTQTALVAQLEAQVNQDQAAIDNARAVLAYTTITAPISARTGIRQVDVGNIVHASDSTGIVVLTQLRPISILFTLPQQQFSRVNKAFEAGVLSIEALGPDNQTVIDRGKLVVIDNQVDQTTGTFVYVARPDNTAAVQQVTVSQQDDKQAVITRGLQPNERVITSGFSRLTDGGKVAATSADAPPAPPSAERPRGPGRGDGAARSEGRPGGGGRRSERSEGAATTSSNP